ncbi:MAG: hypothetical protein KAR13_04215, partial [Desulfobulbaceae bacterium]|nr:hypothetical protein [Desulfobulbaceae bacterium]
ISPVGTPDITTVFFITARMVSESSAIKILKAIPFLCYNRSGVAKASGSFFLRDVETAAPAEPNSVSLLTGS